MTTTTIDMRALAEELADVLEERGLVCAAATGPRRVLDTADVAEQLGRDRSWVYDHAAELGAFRMGTGPKARLGFDQLTIDTWKRQQTITPQPEAAAPRRPRRGRASSQPDLIPYEETP